MEWVKGSSLQVINNTHGRSKPAVAYWEMESRKAAGALAPLSASWGPRHNLLPRRSPSADDATMFLSSTSGLEENAIVSVQFQTSG